MKITGINKTLLFALCSLILTPTVWSNGTQENTPPLEELPQNSELWISLVQGVILPTNHKTYTSQSSVKVEFIAQSGQSLKKGDIWAILDPKQLEISTKSLELAELDYKLQLKSLRKAEAEFLEQQNALIAETSYKLAETRYILKQNRSADSHQKLQDIAKELQKKIESLKQEIAPESLEENFYLKSSELELKLTKAQLDHEQLKKRLQLKAPFHGQLTIYIDFIENFSDSKGEIIPSEIYASITDDKEYMVQVSTQNSNFNQPKLDDIVLSLDLPDSPQPLKAIHKRAVKLRKSTYLGYEHLFQFTNAQDSELAKQYANQNRAIHVYKKLPFPCRIITKSSIALVEPDILKTQGWHGLISHLYPGSVIEAIGANAIAIRALDAEPQTPK